MCRWRWYSCMLNVVTDTAQQHLSLLFSMLGCMYQSYQIQMPLWNSEPAPVLPVHRTGGCVGQPSPSVKRLRKLFSITCRTDVSMWLLPHPSSQVWSFLSVAVRRDGIVFRAQTRSQSVCQSGISGCRSTKTWLSESASDSRISIQLTATSCSRIIYRPLYAKRAQPVAISQTRFSLSTPPISRMRILR